MLSKSSTSATPEILEDYYRELDGFNLAPLWEVQESALVNEPTSKAVPHIWRWKDLEPRALRAGRVDWHSRRRVAGVDAAEPRH